MKGNDLTQGRKGMWGRAGDRSQDSRFLLITPLPPRVPHWISAFCLSPGVRGLFQPSEKLQVRSFSCGVPSVLGGSVSFPVPS